MSKDAVRIFPADLSDPAHADAVCWLIDHYARDPMGGADPLPEPVRARLADGLRKHPTTRIWLALAGDAPAGAAVCFLGFSTFEAAPLVNIHDLIVAASYRRQGLGRRLLQAVEDGARALGCSRMTLEVREDNAPARALYAEFGLAGYRLGGEEHTTHFLTRPITP